MYRPLGRGRPPEESSGPRHEPRVVNARDLRKEEREGTFGADEAHRQVDVLQKATDRHISDVDRRGAAKEQEVLEV